MEDKENTMQRRSTVHVCQPLSLARPTDAEHGAGLKRVSRDYIFEILIKSNNP
jgi:hypothetical protein